MENWIADIVGKMHINKITNKDIAIKMGVTPEYISMLLNGKKTTKTAKEAKKSIKVTLVKSYIGYNKDQARTVKALGLNKMNSSNELVDNPCVRGMINKVKHLVRVEEMN